MVAKTDELKCPWHVHQRLRRSPAQTYQYAYNVYKGESGEEGVNEELQLRWLAPNCWAVA